MQQRASKDLKPLVYSCSGCSSLAQLANDLAVWLHADGIAEMSSIAGVGGGVRQLVSVATSGRQIIALDGCSLGCVQRCLALRNVAPTWHIQLTELGLNTDSGEPCSLADTYRALRFIHDKLGVNFDADITSPLDRITG
ncbi:putative zinc-binding protein [Aliidiomarina soli]|uniref:Zinc-binding protein n=1 Tax=Aliidiomarina soli TaxID=1928574 RepID=A0A432WJI3_9GAMM|nr:putative zinc-binding protein [Aliidiomarina soli]RUO33943.1 zinc-binding protein [Aliidiomarina soli]